MRPEPSKFIFEESPTTKKLMPFCLDSISAEKLKGMEEDRKQQENDLNKVDVASETQGEPKSPDSDIVEATLKTRNVKLSDSSSSIERTSEDEETADGKPNHSYISLIANGILSVKEKRLVLSDIYQYVLDNHSYFRNKAGQGWRNSIRHNLSLNECFIKAGRSPNGKGHYWAINPANYDDFSKGDFRRRRAQRRARRAMAFGDLVEHFSPYWSYTPYVSAASPRPTLPATYPTSPTSSYRYSPYYQMPITHRACKSPPCLPSPIDRLVKKQKTTGKRGFDMESLLRDDEDDRDSKNMTTPNRILKRPSSTEISPPTTPRLSPYMRLNLDYFADKRTTAFSPSIGRFSDMSFSTTSSSVYDRYRHFYPSASKAHLLKDEHYRISMVQ